MRLYAFAIATLLPAALLVAGVVWGGVWIWLAPLSVGAFWLAMDPLTALAPREGAFPAGDGLLALTGTLQLVLMPVALWALTGRLHGADWLAGVIGFGLYFGQVGNPAAHELIHRADRWLMRLGVAVYVTFLFGHHVSAHRLVHHVHVATPDDPNSARRGQGYWRFLPRAWIGSFRAGLAAERALSTRAQGRRRNPYALYLGGALGLIALALALFGPKGLAVYLLLASHVQAQLLLSDYVQHYGLGRARLDDGRLEPVAARHSWNAPHWFSAAFMLNAPRHSDHHAHPARPYPALRLGDAQAPGRPMLPRSLPAMAALALFPPFWHRVMDHRVLNLRKPA